MKVQEFETMRKILRLEHLRRHKQLGGAQAELGVFPAAFRPSPAPLAQQTRAHPDKRLDTELLGNIDDLAQFLEFLDHHDHFFSQLGSQKRDPDEIRVLVSVTNNQTAKLALQGQPGEELGLAPNLQAEIKRFPCIQNLFHHFAELINLNRENTAVTALVVEFRNRIAKGHVDGLDPMPQDIL